jgi:hypothetical protein
MLDRRNQASGNNKIGLLLLHGNRLTWSPRALASGAKQRSYVRIRLQIASHRHNGAGTSNLAQLCAEQVAKELKRLKEDFPDHHVWRARV